jgi:hypothetical protein
VETAPDGSYYHFNEVARTPDYVEMYDPSRGDSVRLYDDAMYVLGPDGRAWQLGYRGHWAR